MAVCVYMCLSAERDEKKDRERDITESREAEREREI
jgi:hypothetical protein